MPRIRGEPGERRMVRYATLGSRPGGAAPQGEVVRSGSQKTDAGFLCHENTTSLLSVFGPGSRQHVRRQQSNGAESRDRKVVSAEALPYRQTAGGSCRGKDGERTAFGPNGSGHVVVQLGTAGNRWKMVGSSLGSRGRDEWRCHSRWFCVVVRITAPVAALFHHGARLRYHAGSCADGLMAGICTKKVLESDDSRTRVVCYSAAGRRLLSRTARIPDSG